MRLVGSEISDRNWRRDSKNTGGVLSVDLPERGTKLGEWGGIASLRVAEMNEEWVGGQGGGCAVTEPEVSPKWGEEKPHIHAKEDC